MRQRLHAIDGRSTAAALMVLVGSSVGVAWIEPVLAVPVAAAIVVTLALSAFRWPRALLLLAALVPLGDPFLLRAVLPAAALPAVSLLSEMLVLIVGGAIGVRALREDTLWPALRHPLTVFLASFLLISAASAVLNGTPPLVAAAGVVFTADALALFYLARASGASYGWARRAVLTVLGVAAVASGLALAQALLAPDILWFRAFPGSFGEGGRVTGLFGNPNMLGAVLGLALPFAVLPIRHELRWRRAAYIALAFLIMLVLLLSFSRGAWLGSAVGFGTVALVLDRRALLVALLIGAAALLTASLMPRNLLVAEGEQPGFVDGAGPVRPDYFDSTMDRFAALGDGRDLRARFVLEGLPIILDRPALGVGPGMYGGAAASVFDSPIYARYGTSLYGFNTVHNFWLHLLGELGIAGLLAFLGMLLTVGWPLARRAAASSGRRQALLVGILAATLTVSANSVTEMLLEGNSSAFLFWYLLGIASVLREDGAPPAASAEP